LSIEQDKLFYFEVKFYPKEPTTDLHDETTRCAVMTSVVMKPQGAQ